MTAEENFSRELKCTYKNEQYVVRDNGAVLRYPRDNNRPRPTDNKWTFGKPNDKTGYMEIAAVRIHRIVATAFHGESPTNEHVVDHIDTNKRNNRPENLRWVTRLENILLNPITAKRIEMVCGSVEVFLANPANFRDKFPEPNYQWMCTVSKEEAQTSLECLTSWAKSDKKHSGGSLGDWIFNRTTTQKQLIEEESENSGLIMSKTPQAAQRIIFLSDKPNEYPCTPQEIGYKPLTAYADNLKEGAIFCYIQNGSIIVVKSGFSKDCLSLYVMTKTANVWREQENGEYIPISITELSKEDYDDSELSYGLTKVTYNNGLFIHERVTTGFAYSKKEQIEKFFADSTQG